MPQLSVCSDASQITAQGMDHRFAIRILSPYCWTLGALQMASPVSQSFRLYVQLAYCKWYAYRLNLQMCCARRLRHADRHVARFLLLNLAPCSSMIHTLVHYAPVSEGFPHLITSPRAFLESAYTFWSPAAHLYNTSGFYKKRRYSNWFTCSTELLGEPRKPRK